MTNPTLEEERDKAVEALEGWKRNWQPTLDRLRSLEDENRGLKEQRKEPPPTQGEMATEYTLVVMPLGEMKRHHPDQIHRNCSECGCIVGIYPSGQNMMKANPDIKIMCTRCALKNGIELAAL